ncbi:DMT family transporter [Bordetella hinzii]|uniref:EamA-like transporter family protein n=1 Tax=Bordetella hinzii OH87 BAL007II TaxID=1331262 RepID=A0ABR4R5A0_9BORD|nr:DMT family transporter [Bordetella hinzii]KCB25764.1 EamA-like transporter family protein [Bordetella hinzii OH87 BAL007II]KCB40328.1 EamA-like transporter family protein [Bordetella hinzii 5132]QDJ42973.1 EamA family transporter [Bordetella hinzii]QDJ47544.1 EamA family transporter [Bordetella hinzii]
MPFASPLFAYLCLAGAMLTVGSTVVAGKLIGHALPPFTATALRFALALPCLALLMRWRGVRIARPDRHDALLLIVQALAGSAGYTVLLLWGLRLSAGADAGVMLGSLPAMAALMAVLVLREPLTRGLVTGVLLATLGVWLVARAAPPQASVGHALVLAAVACEAVFILLNKRLHQPLPALAQATAMTALGLLWTLPGLWWESGAWLHATDLGPALAAVLFYALVPTVLGFWLWYVGAAQVPAARAALFTALAPAAAVLLSALVLDETISAGQWSGLALVMLALPWRGSAQPRHQEA